MPTALLAGLLLAGAPAAQPAFADAAEAFKAGVMVCHRSFEGLKTQKPFGSELSSPGFVLAPGEAAAPGVRSIVLGLDQAVIGKASLGEAATGAVYVVSGAAAGGLPNCRVVAVRAAGAGLKAKAWFEDPRSGWSPKSAEEHDDSMGLVSRTYGRPFQGDIGVGATINVVEGQPKGDMTALSSFSLARDR